MSKEVIIEWACPVYLCGYATTDPAEFIQHINEKHDFVDFEDLILERCVRNKIE